MTGLDRTPPWTFPPPDASTRVPAPPVGVPRPPAPVAPARRSSRRRFAAALTLTVALSGIGGFVIGRGIANELDDGARGSHAATTTAPAPAPTPAPPTTAPAGATPPTSTPPDTAAPPVPVAPPTTALPAPERSTTSKLDLGVVDIDTKLAYERTSAAGTGMVISASGEVLTNNHVIEGATSITVTVVTTGEQYEATVVGTDPTDDVALLQLQGAAGLTPVALGTSSRLQVGDAVTSVGNAGGVGGPPTVASGTVSALDQDITATDAGGGDPERLTGLIETDARMQPGMSGGPLYDADTKVVGMNAAGSSIGRRLSPSRSSDSFAITIDKAMSVVEQIRSGQASDTVRIGPRAFLGVEITDDDPATPGAVVSRVLEDTPAATSGLADGDVIVSVDGAAVDTGLALGDLLRKHTPGDTVRIGWIDAGGQQRSATVTLIAGPPD